MLFYQFVINPLLRLLFKYPSFLFFIQNIFNRHFLCTVVGIIRDDQGRILLLDHRYRNEPSALPAGFMKKGESPFDSIVRELKEETNFDIIPQRIINVIPLQTAPHLNLLSQLSTKAVNLFLIRRSAVIPGLRNQKFASQSKN